MTESFLLAPSEGVNHRLAMLVCGDCSKVSTRVHLGLYAHWENCKHVNVLSVLLLHAEGEDTIEGLRARVNGGLRTWCNSSD